LKHTSVASALTVAALPGAGAVAAVAAFGAVAVWLAWRSLTWPLIHDVALMHYAAWRIGEGAVPYRDLFDMNQPGTYLIHLAVLRTVGGGDLGWRIVDLAALAATVGAIAVFAAPWGALASASGAVVFATYHLAGGAWQAGQRDFLLCPLLVVAALGVARWIERGRWTSLAWSGVALGAGITVKPHVAIFAGALAAVVAVVGARACGAGTAAAATGVFVVATAAAPLAVVAWLAVAGGLAAWYEIVTGYLIPLYSRLGRASSWSVYRWHAWIPITLGVAISFATAFVRRGAGARHLLAALGLAYGVVHYVAQGKGWEYHLYPLAVFAAVLLGAELPAALAARRRVVAGALAAALVASLVLLDAKALEASAAEFWWAREATVRTLEADLRARLAPGDTVQVLDTTGGGIHALFRLRVRQPTRFLYDFHFFHDEGTPVVQALRAELIRDLRAHPPRLIVLVEQAWPAGGYERVERFPALAALLRTRYEAAVTRADYTVYAKRHDS
jgi:hypothetical protein